jgi:Ca2+-transporting ATPase
MEQPPRRPTEPLVSSAHIGLSLIQGTATTLVVVLLYWLSLRSGVGEAESRTIAFVTLVAANCALLFSSRSTVAGVGRALGGITPISYWVVGGTLLALAAVTCVPLLAGPFGFAQPPMSLWFGALAAGGLTFMLFELAKFGTAAAKR